MTYPCHPHGKSRGGARHSHWASAHGHNRVAGTTTLGERGQAVIPREAREALGLESGDKLVVFCNEARGSVTLVKADVFEDFADIIMAKSKKLEKVANVVWEAVYDEEYDEAEAAADDEASADAGASDADVDAGDDAEGGAAADDETER